MIENYIYYYSNERLQRNLGILTPMGETRPALSGGITKPSESNDGSCAAIIEFRGCHGTAVP